MKRHVVQTGLLVGLLFLSGCASRHNFEQLETATLPTRHVIQDVPFFTQQSYFCGPATLAEIGQYYGSVVTPDTLVPKVVVPERQGSLQIEMVAAARSLGFVSYAKHGKLSDILNWVAIDTPVIVLQNNGLSWYPQWHYAVVVGFDTGKRQVILHTGEHAYRAVDLDLFVRTWLRSEAWYQVILPPNTVPTLAEPIDYIEAAHTLLKVGRHDDGISALKTAVQTWPDQWLAYFVLANHYGLNEPELAIHWLSNGLHVGKYHAVYLNNYASLLAHVGCKDEALIEIDKAIALKPDAQWLIQTKSDIVNTQNSTCALTQRH